MPPQQLPEEIDELLRFVAEKAKDVKSPMSIKGLCREFKTETGSLLSIGAFASRIVKYRQEIPKMKEVDINTKVRMMFAVSAPVDAGFFNEIKKQADVELDDANRIIRYKSIDGSLKLEGDHSVSAKSRATNSAPIPPEEIAELMNFIAKKSEDVKSTMNIEALIRQFRLETGSLLPLTCIQSRIARYRKKMHQMPEFDINTKVKMTFAMSAPVDAKFLIELKQQAYVEVDEYDKIIKYKSNDGSLELEGEHRSSNYTRARRANKRKTRVVIDSSESEDDSSEEVSDEEGGSVTMSWATKIKRKSIDQSVAYRSTRRKEEIAETVKSRDQSTLSGGRKRPRISHSSSSEESDDDSMGNKDEFDFDQPNNNRNNVPIEQKPELIIENAQEVKEELMKEDKDEDEDIQLVDNVTAAEPNEQSSTDVSYLLLALRGPLAAIRSQSIQDLLTNIEEKIRKLEPENKRFALQDIPIPFNACLFVLKKNAVPECEEESTSLRDFLFGLRTGISFIRHPSIASFHRELDTLIQQLTLRDKRIPVEIAIRAVLAALITIAP